MDTKQQIRSKVLQALYAARSANPSQSLGVEDVAKKLDLSRDILVLEIAYLEERDYLRLKSRTLKGRVFSTLELTAKGVDVVEGQDEYVVEEPVRILFLSSNPRDTLRLGLDQEVRAIDASLQQARFRDRFDLRQHGAVRVGDLQECLLRHEPHIVHFSGHGTQSSELILEDDQGNSQTVSARALSTLFSVLKANIRCVVLNACYSEQQARAIAEHIDCVIGMSNAVSDSAVISFSSSFYGAIGYGRDIQTAFDLGRVAIDLDNLDEQDKPKLLAPNSDPRSIVLVHNK